MAVICPSCDRELPPDATAGRSCPTCGTQLLEVADSEDLVGTVVDGRFEMTIDPAKLVPLDGRDGAPPPPRPKPARPPTPPPVLAELAPPVETKLELEEAWQKERAVRVAAPPPNVRARRPIGGAIVALVLIAIAAAVVIYFVRRPHAPEQRLPGGDGVVVIRIVGPGPTEVTIDNVRVGKTPLRLNLQKGKKVYIAALVRDVPVSFDFVPDHEQVIDLAGLPH